MASDPLETTARRPDLQPEQGSRCTRCGASFSCGAVSGAARCWCADLPVLNPLPAGPAGCLCPDCLEALLARG